MPIVDTEFDMGVCKLAGSSNIWVAPGVSIETPVQFGIGEEQVSRC